MRNSIKVFAACILFSTTVFAQQNAKPEFAFIPEVGARSSFQAQVGGGLLDDKGLTGSHGSPIYVLVKANYAPNDDVGLFIDFPMAGTWSGGPDDFGIGNISMGINRRMLQSGNATLSLGADFTFPTSQSAAAIGKYTRNFYSFVKDQYAISPFVNVVFSTDKFLASFDAGLNEQIFTSRLPGQDRYESVLFYDGGLSMAMNGPKDFWATLEFGGYSSLTYATNDTVLFGGPGVRYQDEETSVGLHLQVPFSGPAKDQIDLLVMTDVRFKF